LELDRLSRPENVSSTISNSSRNGENHDHAIPNLQRNDENRDAFLEGRIVMILEGFLLDYKLESSTSLLLLRAIVFWKRVVPQRMIAPLLKTNFPFSPKVGMASHRWRVSPL
jgi:hypothetical protein